MLKTAMIQQSSLPQPYINLQITQKPVNIINNITMHNTCKFCLFCNAMFNVCINKNHQFLSLFDSKKIRKYSLTWLLLSHQHKTYPLSPYE